MTKLLRLLTEACTTAGDVVLGDYRSSHNEVSIHVKDPTDPRTLVNAADLASEQAIVSVLQRRLSCTFLSEELGETFVNGPSQYRVIVDPLDGSKNFAQHSLGLFGISVGVEKAGHLFAGAIYLPYFQELLLAERGRGVYFGILESSRNIQFHSLDLAMVTSSEFPLNRARISIARGTAPPSILSRPPIATLLGSCNESINYASCSVGLASVALNRIDALVLPSQKYWDIAAGVVILQELAFSVGIWRNEWRDEIDEADLACAGASDCFDIVAAGNSDLFNQIVSVLQMR